MTYKILVGDVLDRLRQLPDNSVHCVVTSPPYWGLRDYGTGTWEGGDPDHEHDTVGARGGRGGSGSPGKQTEGATPSRFAAPSCSCGAERVDHQIGLEATPAEFLAKMVAVFAEVRRVLRPDGTCWVNMGDSYASKPNGPAMSASTLQGSKVPHAQTRIANSLRKSILAPGLKHKDLVGMPWRLAFALQEDGWWLRQDIIWSKPNPMPESVTDRCTKAHEYLFLLTKSARYYYDAEAVKERVTGNAHARGDGVNPKAHGANSKMNADRDPAHLANPKSKQNASFSAAVNELVSSRNKRSVWEIATEAFPEAHFATFPTKLVEPCILAGTSEKGVCERCATPWVRELEKTVEFASGSGRSGIVPTGKHAGGAQEDSGTYDIRMGPVASTKTVGWKRGCACEGLGAVASTVLDPFNGSGTTGLVALANRCDYIGIELNPEYAAMAERRLQAASLQGVLL